MKEPSVETKIEYKLWYHGTNKESASKILKNGFKEGTYFARHLEDALGFGGEYVFEVALKLNHKYWELITKDVISADRIVRLKKYKRPNIEFENKKLGDEVFNWNLENNK